MDQIKPRPTHSIRTIDETLSKSHKWSNSTYPDSHTHDCYFFVNYFYSSFSFSPADKVYEDTCLTGLCLFQMRAKPTLNSLQSSQQDWIFLGPSHALLIKTNSGAPIYVFSQVAKHNKWNYSTICAGGLQLQDFHKSHNLLQFLHNFPLICAYFYNTPVCYYK